jgi:uncharacterized protein YigA (DUF484 family)
LAAKHHIELGKADKEGTVFINQGQVQLLAEGVREHSAEFKATESGSQNKDTQFHGLSPYQSQLTRQSKFADSLRIAQLGRLVYSLNGDNFVVGNHDRKTKSQPKKLAF